MAFNPRELFVIALNFARMKGLSDQFDYRKYLQDQIDSLADPINKEMAQKELNGFSDQQLRNL